MLRGEQRDPPAALFWQWNKGRAVRRGDWKLVAIRNDPWELYSITADGTELNNLADTHPERVRELQQLWSDWAGRTGAKAPK